MAVKKELNLEEAEKVSGGTFKTAEEVMAAVDKIKMGTGKTSTPATPAPAESAPAQPATPGNPGGGGNTNTNTGKQISQQGEGNQLSNSGGNITIS